MGNDDIDRELHEWLSRIWKAYRSGMKEFNECARMICGIEKKSVKNFAEKMWLSLAPEANRKGGVL